MKRTAILTLSITAACLVLTGAGCKKDDPDKVIKEMQENLTTLNSVSMEGSLNLEQDGKNPFSDFTTQLGQGEGGAEQSVDLEARFSGDIHMSEEKEPLVNMVASLEIADSSHSIEGEVGLKMTAEQQFMEIRAFEMMNSELNLSLANMIGFWYEIPEDTKKPKKAKKTAEQREEDLKNIKRAKFFVVEDNHGSEKLDGVKTYHYTTRIDKEKIRGYAMDSAKNEGKEMTDGELAELDEQLDQLAKATIDMWIGQNDKHLYQLKIDGLSMVDKKTNAETEADLFMKFSNHNSAPEVKAPDNPRTGKQLGQDFMFAIFTALDPESAKFLSPEDLAN